MSVEGSVRAADKLLKGKLFVPDAIRGLSAYEIAVIHGFKGTEEEWLSHLEVAQSESIKESAEQVSSEIETDRQAALSDIAKAKATMLEEIELAAEIVQTTGNGETAVMSQKASSNAFANALKGTASGETVKLDDISPLEHEMSVKLSSDTLTDLSTVKLYKVGKNLLDAVNAPAFTNLQDNSSINVEKTNTGCKFIGKRDTISNSGRFGYQFMPIARLRGKTVTLSFKRYSEANDTNTSTCALIQAAVNDFDGDLSLFTTPLTNANTYGEIKLSAAVNGYFTYTFVVPENETRENLFIIFYAGVGAVVPQNGVIEYSEVQAEVDNVATEYEPGVYAEYTPNADGTVEGVTSCQYPTTELHTDTEGVIIEVQYIKDTNSFCHDITTALMGEIVKAENALNNELAIIVSNITRIEQECKYSRNALYGKKWVACGDSYTAGDFTGFVDENGLSGKDSPLLYDTEWQMYKTYPWWIAKRNNMTLINEARCGTTMALTKQYVDGEEGYAESYRNPFSLNRYKAIPTDTDYITLWFGINDRSNTHLGNIADTENTTFYGAWNVVLEYLITNMPYAKIGIIVTNRCNEEYRQAIRDIAKKWGIPYLDMMGDDKVPLIFGRETNLGLSETAYSLRNDAFSVSTSNPHPNIKAHEYESTFVEDFLRRL